MSDYVGLIHSNGPDELVIESGGRITAAGTQAAHIADAADASGAAPTAEEYATVVAKLNAVLAALEGVGVLASS